MRQPIVARYDHGDQIGMLCAKMFLIYPNHNHGFLLTNIRSRQVKGQGDYHFAYGEVKHVGVKLPSFYQGYKEWKIDLHIAHKNQVI